MAACIRKLTRMKKSSCAGDIAEKKYAVEGGRELYRRILM